MVERIVLEIYGATLREAGITDLWQLEFCLFGDSCKERVQGGTRYNIQDRYVDFREKIESLPPGVLRMMQKIFRLPAPGRKLALYCLGFLEKKDLHKHHKIAEKQLREFFEKDARGRKGTLHG
jgi:hypothetical protein